ncbi:MAG: MBL fold metallo-hydrolase [Planctomycetota bacterium]|nr:MBL fold metallo-hydrolase [Planctomycetota bacterium]
MPFRTEFRFRPYHDARGERLPNPEPRQIYGPVHSIGPLTVCAYLVATPDGLVVVDTGYESDGELLPDNIRKLGFEPRDIRLILLTHWHWDHIGGAARLAELSGAPVMVHELDAGIVESGSYRGERKTPPVGVARRLKDGDAIERGGVAFRTIHAPGQSAGEVVFLAEVDGPDGPCRVLFAGDATGFKHSVKGLDELGYPGVCADYRRAVKTLEALEFDLYLGGHPHQVFNEMREDGNPFVTREEYRRMLSERHRLMEEFVARHPRYLEW